MQSRLLNNSRKSKVKEGMRVDTIIAALTLDGFLLPALATGYADFLVGSKELDLILDGLVSSISGIIVNTPSTTVGEAGLMKLTTLNTLCEVDDTFWSRVKESRIVMLLKTVLNWPSATDGSSISWVLSTELLRFLRSLLPWIQHIDGDFWKRGLKLLTEALEVPCHRLSI